MRVTNEGLGSAGDSGAQGESPGLVTVREFCVFTGESGESGGGKEGAQRGIAKDGEFRRESGAIGNDK